MSVDPQLLSIALRYDKADMGCLSVSAMRDLRLTNSVQNPSVGTSAAASVQPPGSTGTTEASGSNDVEAKAVGFVRRLTKFDGADPNAALKMVIDTYAPNVSYYGKPRTLSELPLDKQKYSSGGPNGVTNGLVAPCANENCMVSGIYDWTVRSLARNNQARGLVLFSYTISLSPSPKIVAEDGKVLKN